MLKRLATSRVALIVVAVVLLIVGFVVGARVADARFEEQLHALMLVQAQNRLIQATDLARALRDGHVEPARERIETHIDMAIIDMGHHYSPARDSDGHAARALGVARAYREAYPEHFQRSALADMVQPALDKLPK